MSNHLAIIMDTMTARCKELNIPVRKDTTTPNHLTCYNYEVIFSKLCENLNREKILEFVEGELNKVLEIWKKVIQANANDIYLVLVGPDGSFNDPNWNSLASEIERDERLCRKLVWLPSKENDEKMFLRRTFLAQPWIEGNKLGVDSLALLEREPSIPSSWLEVLKNKDIDGSELVDELLIRLNKDGI